MTPLRALAALALGLAARPALGDDATHADETAAAEAGSIGLRLVDGGGDPIDLSGLHLTLEDEDGGAWTVAVADDGLLHAGGLAPGRYRLRLGVPGYVLIAREIVVEPGAQLQLTLRLEADQSSTMTVTAPDAAEQLRSSAEAVTVIETDAAQRQAADLGEVLARTQGVSVRRAGGLGSAARFSMAGLMGDQVRFFLDGVPLELMGHPLGVANVPVDLAQRVELYRGVVPVRFGADALGGAVNLVSETEGAGSTGSLGYQAGSFGTHRAAAQMRHTTGGGLRVAASAHLDAARNDYLIDVEVPDESGRLQPATVPRFHDAYRMLGASLEAGLVQQAWADRLTLRVFAADLTRELQHNVVMTVPYGEPRGQHRSQGALLRYQHSPTEEIFLDTYVGVTRARLGLQDLGRCIYDWTGACVRERDEPGEITGAAIDQLLDDRAGTGRLRARWRAAPGHTLEVSVTPAVFRRQGPGPHLGRRRGDRSPLGATDAGQVVSGLEHAVADRAERYEGRTFIKHYAQRMRSEEFDPIQGLVSADRDTQRLGAGHGSRLWLGPGCA